MKFLIFSIRILLIINTMGNYCDWINKFFSIVLWCTQSKILKKNKLDLQHFWYTDRPRTKPWISSLSSGRQPNVTSILNSLRPNTPSGNKVWFNLACTHTLITFFTTSILMFSYIQRVKFSANLRPTPILFHLHYCIAE